MHLPMYVAGWASLGNRREITYCRTSSGSVWTGSMQTTPAEYLVAERDAHDVATVKGYLPGIVRTERSFTGGRGRDGSGCGADVAE